MGLRIDADADPVDWPEEFVRRLSCHMLLERLPDEALVEALEALTEAYSVRLHRLLPVPLAKPTRTLKAKVGRAVVRPVYPVSDEE